MKTYFSHYKKQFIIGPAFKLSEAILELFIPLIMAKIVDVGIKNGDVPYILKMGGLMILLGTLGFLFAVICQYSAAVAQQGVGTELRRDLFRKIHTLSKKQQDSFSDATLTTRMINDVNQIQSGVAMFIRLAFRWPFIILGSLLAATVIDLKMSVIFFIAALLLSALLYYVLSRSLPLYRKIQEKLDHISAIAQDALSGVRVIRAFQKNREHKEKFSSVNEHLTAVSLRVSKLNACLNPLSFALLNVCMVLLLHFGALRVQIGTLTQGQVIALTNYMTQILLSIMIFANVIVTFTKAAASMERVEEILKTEPDMKEGTVQSIDSTAPLAAAFRKVSFSYSETGDKAISDMSLDLPRGAHIGIVGVTGSGKSTLMRLLCRLYDVTEGEILFFGKPIQDYSFSALHSAVHFVSQENPLFKGTIRENLLCGKVGISKEALLSALDCAAAKDFVLALPKGLDSPVEEGGKNFSGGQRQRLCIARAFLGDPKILIFDDSLSALDFATEAKIRRAIADFGNDKTVIFISQRISAVKDAKRIFVLDDGTLSAVGTHASLLESSALYREICRTQNAEKEETICAH